MASFQQEGPNLENQFTANHLLQHWLKFRLPEATLAEIQPDLEKFGKRVVSDIKAIADRANSTEPRHIPFDSWGKRIDIVETSDGWQDLHELSAQEALVAIAYQRKYGEFSRIYQFTKLFLFHPVAAFYTCPLAMTDGAARAIELYGEGKFEHAFQRLTTTDPQKFWTSGQWMTEKTGGSDVGQTETIAKLENGEYKLYGIKFFTSAISSDIAMTLARIEGEVEGSKGLSLFYVELRDQNGSLQNIEVQRLKSKLGTKALPTAELKLEGTPAKLVGSKGDGVKKIAALFNITRSYNSVCALGELSHALALATNYAKKRQAFGKLLKDHALHVETLADLHIQQQAAFHITFHMCHLLGKVECEDESNKEESALLRLLTPVGKLFTGKLAVSITSEAIECVGGTAYMEDSGMARLLRDAQVFPIWEGTTNILSLDMLRAIKVDNVIPIFFADVQKRIQQIHSQELNAAKESIQSAVAKIQQFFVDAQKKDSDYIQASARSLAMSIAKTYAASLMLEFADWNQKQQTSYQAQAQIAASRWCDQELVNLHIADEKRRTDSAKLISN